MYDFYLLWYLNQNYCRQKFWTLSWVKKSWDLHIASSRPFMQYLKVKVIRCNVIFRWWRVDDDTSKTNNSKKSYYRINFCKLYSMKKYFSYYQCFLLSVLSLHQMIACTLLLLPKIIFFFCFNLRVWCLLAVLNIIKLWAIRESWNVCILNHTSH